MSRTDKETHARRMKNPLGERDAQRACEAALVHVHRQVLFPDSMTTTMDAVTRLLREALALTTGLGSPPPPRELRATVHLLPRDEWIRDVEKRSNVPDAAKARLRMHAALRIYASAWAASRLRAREFRGHAFEFHLTLMERLTQLAGELGERLADAARIGAEVRERALSKDWERFRMETLMPKERTGKGLKPGPFKRAGAAVAAEVMEVLTAEGDEPPPWSDSELAALFGAVGIKWLSTPEEVRFFRHEKRRRRRRTADR